MVRTGFVLLAALALLGGCGKAPPLRSTPSLTVVSEAALPAPTRVDQSAQNRPYLVGPFDKLKISVFGIEELKDRIIQVDAGGRASFPLAGSFEAAGHTPLEIEQELTRRLAASYIRDPQVTVNLEDTVSQVVTVDGQVLKPGLYPVIGKMSLMQAVATAGGAGEFAKLEDVVVFRNSDGRRYAALYNLAAIRRGYYDDPEIYAGDIVVVGDSTARRLFRDLIQAAPLLTTPIIAFLQNNGNN
jgi:polysaccharide export outer membrane protein